MILPSPVEQYVVVGFVNIILSLKEQLEVLLSVA